MIELEQYSYDRNVFNIKNKKKMNLRITVG